MADHDESIYLRDASLEDEVRALVADIATNPNRIVVDAYPDPDDPEYHLVIEIYPTSYAEQQEWVSEIRARLRDQLDVDDAPTGRELEALEAG